MDSLNKPLSVSDLTHQIRSLVENGFSEVLVSGEISNFTRHSSGHLYFTIKDARSELSVVMFRGNSQFLRFKVESGMQVTINGNISLYEQRGRLQLIARSMEPAGVGTLYLAFEALKRKLGDEGLFLSESKKQITQFPRRVGVITSPTGAAVQDIFQVLQRRAPYTHIFLRPTQVQGTGAAADIVDAIYYFEKTANVDTIIIGRGGGSLEDLWAFNEEPVVRAIFDCSIPIISAVGHETDFSLSDLVADLRAPTPSAAAEIVATSKQEILDQVNNYYIRMSKNLEGMMNSIWQQCDTAFSRLEYLKPQKQITRAHENIESISAKLTSLLLNRLSLDQANLNSYRSRLNALNPESVLERGYSIAYTLPEGKVIRSNIDISDNSSFELQTGGGRFQAIKIHNVEGEKS